jgi:Cu+-exporting ATPase
VTKSKDEAQVLLARAIRGLMKLVFSPEIRHQELQLPKVAAFEAVAGHGIRAKVEERCVLMGNRRLMHCDAVDFTQAELPMRRLEAEGKTAMLIAIEGKLAGVIAVADTLKPEAQDAVTSLQQENIEVVMLSGDNRRTAEAIAHQLGITRVIAEVLPQDKAKLIQSLQKEGKIVAMVGDGVNDAPALAAADIGIAIGSGSDVAKETGGIILVRDNVADVVTAIRLSRATLRKIKQNLFWASFTMQSVSPSPLSVSLTRLSQRQLWP